MSTPWNASVWRVGRLLVVVAAGALAVAALGVVPASAQLPPSNDPLPGSSVQGADGNQDDGNGYRDWEFLHAAGRVQHSPDPNDLDSAFKGGNAGKENAPGDWDLRAEAGGVNPPKANIRDAWSAVGQPGADTFLYLAFTREGDESLLGRKGGTTFVTFELNRDDRLWNNGHADIPCRRDRRHPGRIRSPGQRHDRRSAPLDHHGERPSRPGAQPQDTSTAFRTSRRTWMFRARSMPRRSRVTFLGPMKGRCLRNGLGRLR